MADIVIIEDNKTIRDGLKILLESVESGNNVKTYPDCENFFSEEKGIKSDVVLIDLDLPGMSGIEGIKKIKEKNRAASTVVLTTFDENENLFKALCAGAQGYVVKKTPPKQLVNILRSIIHKRSHMSAYIAHRIIKQYSAGKKKEKRLSKHYSSHELEILSKLAGGNSMGAVALAIDSSLEELQKIIFEIYSKLKYNCDCKN